MPGWQSELEALLSQLHVSLDQGRLPSQAARSPTPQDAKPEAGDPNDSMDRYIPWELGALTAEDAPADGDEVHAVRSELEATVRRVVTMARLGQMESTLRDDVVFVLQALTRPHPYEKATKRRGKSDEASQEWQLASAAAVLRFCRIVLRLTDALAREVEP